MAEAQERVTSDEFAGWAAAAELALWFDPWAAHGELIARMLSLVDGKQRHGWEYYPGGAELYRQPMDDDQMEQALGAAYGQ